MKVYMGKPTFVLKFEYFIQRKTLDESSFESGSETYPKDLPSIDLLVYLSLFGFISD